MHFHSYRDTIDRKLNNFVRLECDHFSIRMGNNSSSNDVSNPLAQRQSRTRADANNEPRENEEETKAVVNVSGEWTPVASLCDSDIELLLNVTLVCTVENTREDKKLVFKPPPSTVVELKQQIQEQLNIPACVQKLSFGHTRLEDDRTLHYYTIRDEDQLCLEYPIAADVGEIQGTIDCMKRMAGFLDSIQSQLTGNPVSLEVRTEIADNVDWTPVEKLASEYLLMSNPRAGTNRLLFVREGGLAVVHCLHSLLLRQPWEKICSVRLQYLENALLRVVWNVTACFELRREVLAYPHLENIVESFLRVPIPLRSSIRAPSNMYMTTVGLYEQNLILCQVLYKALAALCNLAELPECQLQISSNRRVLDQLRAVLLTPTYTTVTSQVVMGGLVCLAYNPQAHTHLLNEELISCVMEACFINRDILVLESEQKAHNDILLVRYFAAMFLAHVTIADPDRLPQLPAVLSFMESFLATAKDEEVHSAEEKNGFVWSTVLPSFRLAFHPQPSRSIAGGAKQIDRKCHPVDTRSECERQAWLLCMEAGIFSLQNTLRSPVTRKTMALDEKLSGYLVCMPWSVPRGSRARQRAQDLIAYTGPFLRRIEGVECAPPKLEVMARARLATICLGLEAAMSWPVQQIAAELYPNVSD